MMDKMRLLSENKNLKQQIEWFQKLIDCRAGKLLLKGKPFIVVANDETYFTSVYLLIRVSEQAKGTWLEECETCFQSLTHYDEPGDFPIPTPELHEVIKDAREKWAMKEEIEKLQTGNKVLNSLLDSSHATQDKLRKWLRESTAKIEQLQSTIKHCENCGGSWVDDGVNSECHCEELKLLRKQLQDRTAP